VLDDASDVFVKKIERADPERDEQSSLNKFEDRDQPYQPVIF
jgi:hypothetical protein